MTKTEIFCDRCGTKCENDYHWASVKFYGNLYLYDDGTVPQDIEWNVCLNCKIALQEFMKSWLENKAKGK